MSDGSGLGKSGTDIPFMARSAHEIPKPRDWQPFQRCCVILFQQELKDPHAMEYGRGGQDQGGIDILGRRDGKPDHFVGVQCRKVQKPLKREKILANCQAALKLEAGLKELIFATTAPDHRPATDAAISVERQLRNEGHDLRVVLYGWESLQTLIAKHEAAYMAFVPSAVSSHAAVPLIPVGHGPAFSGIVAGQLFELMRQSGMAIVAPVAPDRDLTKEDPALHGRIDAYRDLLKEGDSVTSHKGLLTLLDSGAAKDKPWAQYRILTNLAAAEFELGREQDAVVHLEAAHALRPGDAMALANLGLARTVQGRFEEAVTLAGQALALDAQEDDAVLVLLQAAARTSWEGDPRELFPPGLVGTPGADLGLATFAFTRSGPGWEDEVLALSRRHPYARQFRPLRAMAVLSRALRLNDSLVGGKGALDRGELEEAANDLQAMAIHHLDVGSPNEHDRVAYISNACLLLRLLSRHEEVVQLLRRASDDVGRVPQLRLLLALALVAQDRRTEAIQAIEGNTDVENTLFASELIGIKDPGAALDRLRFLDNAVLDARMATLRWNVTADLALAAGRPGVMARACDALRSLDPGDPVPDVLQLRQERRDGLDDTRAGERLRDIARCLPGTTKATTLYMVASDLLDCGLAGEASHLLDGRVEYSRPSPLVLLHLRCLAGARRDEAFRQALAAAGTELRSSPDVLWLAAAHGWNTGDLEGAAREVGASLAQAPDHPSARLLKVEILARQDRTTELMAELESRLEDLPFRQLSDKFRVASLLGHFGHTERAMTLSYRLFLQNREEARSWKALASLVLAQGMGRRAAVPGWEAPVVTDHVAVDVEWQDGGTLFLIVEPDAALRSLDPESWEPLHPLVKVIRGLAVGDGFTSADGRRGTIKALRHKFVARCHYVLANYEARFPDKFFFHTIKISTDGSAGALDEVREQLRNRHEWVQHEMDLYVNGPVPLALLAQRLGTDVIEAAGALRQQGVRLKVALGNAAEREAAVQAVQANGRQGCVIDLQTFWVAWRLGALDAVAALCGPINLARGVVDRLRARALELEGAQRDGRKVMGYQDGRIALQETRPEVFRTWVDETRRAIAWIEANATTRPVEASERLPSDFRDYLGSGQGEVLDAVSIAFRHDLLLVIDDLATRQVAGGLGGMHATWLHNLCGLAVQEGQLDEATYVRWSAMMIDAGQSYIGLSARSLFRALEIDAAAGSSPGPTFGLVARCIGGREADVQSHLASALGCMLATYHRRSRDIDWKATAAVLLRRLLCERHDDYGGILRTILVDVDLPMEVQAFVLHWSKVNFIPMGDILGSRHEAAAPRREYTARRWGRHGRKQHGS